MEFKKINKNKFNKIFITGGAGFIGSHVSEAFFNNFEGSEIIILDKLTYAGNKKFLSSIINSKLGAPVKSLNVCAHYPPSIL